ncbi:MAG: PEP-CTERM sorting domain-containing protein [Kiritimatiellae bacterium]|nr:PEP-CTERM sorting domain-containing protein [Kiritimatiellia bacterium]
MRKLIVLAAVLFAAQMAMGQSLQWIGDSAVYHVEGTTWYNASATWAASGFNGHGFGDVMSLTLGGEAVTWERVMGVTTEMGYGIDGTHQAYVDLPWLEQSGNNDKWQNMTGADVAASASLGAHTVAVYFRATADAGTTFQWDSNGGANYSATFTKVIPEPTTLALIGLGVAGLVAYRRRR